MTTIIDLALSNWTAHATPADNGWISVCWSPEKAVFCAVAYTGDSSRAMTSIDGQNWVKHPTPAGRAGKWFEVVWADTLGLFVAVGVGKAMTSPDGVTWTSYTIPNNRWRGLCWSPELGLLVAVANDGASDRVITSPDGVTWTSRAISPQMWLSVDWSPDLGQFLACSIAKTLTPTFVPSDYNFAVSSDGVTWTEIDVGSVDRWQDVAWSPSLGLWVTVSNSGIANRAATSPDGINWTEQSTPTRPYPGIAGGFNNSCHTVRWVEEWGRFVAAANSGQYNHIMSSEDGIDWKLHTTPKGSWHSLAFSKELGVIASVAENHYGDVGPSGYRAMTSMYLK